MSATVCSKAELNLLVCQFEHFCNLLFTLTQLSEASINVTAESKDAVDNLCIFTN